jgi:hypothetical protein
MYVCRFKIDRKGRRYCRWVGPAGSCCEEGAEAVEAERTGIYSRDIADTVRRSVFRGEGGFLTGSDIPGAQVRDGVVEDAGAAAVTAHLCPTAAAMVCRW